ncbi:MAG: hypothetical protein IJH71_11275 [Eubacterium sp.]|nr:hypothetical protein [Eubacterium sp.]
MVNKISCKRMENEYCIWHDLHVDDVPVYEYFSECIAGDLKGSVWGPFEKGNNLLQEMAFCWIVDYYWKGSWDFIWELVESSEDEVVPVLSCPDCCEDLDCLLLVAYIRKDNDYVYWDRLGRVIHQPDENETWIKSGCKCKDILPEERWEVYGADTPVWFLEEFEAKDATILNDWIDNHWREECFMRRMNYDRKLYKSKEGVKWITEVNWKFDRHDYEKITSFLKKEYDVEERKWHI